MAELKMSLAAVILTFGLFTGVVQVESADVAYGQFFEDSGTNDTDSSNSTSNSENPDVADIVLLSQKLKKASFGYRHLVGQVKNIGSDTGTYVRVDITTYDKNGDVLGTDFTYIAADSLKPNQKSSFDLGSSSDNFKGMDHYDLSLQWENPDGSEGYVESAKIYKPNTTTYTETPDDMDTNKNTGTHNSAEFPQTSEYCINVKTQLGKELCDKLLNR